jgi:hypothetical protein
MENLNAEVTKYEPPHMRVFTYFCSTGKFGEMYVHPEQTNPDFGEHGSYVHPIKKHRIWGFMTQQARDAFVLQYAEFIIEPNNEARNPERARLHT